MSDTPLAPLSIRTRHRWLRGTALAALLSIVALNRAAYAQQGRVAHADSARTDSAKRRAAAILPVVEVRASIAPIAAPIVGSGIPASIANVAGREMSAWKPRILPDALASQAGVSLYDDLGTPWKTNLSSRGFAVGPTVGLPPGISVFLDGVRQNEPDAQEVNFDLLPIDHIRRVELLNGAASLLGANSLGGAINLVTPRGVGPFSGEVETSGGSFGARSVSADLGGSASEWNYYMSGGAGQERGWRAATGDSRYDGFLNAGRDGARRGFRIQAYAARSRAKTAGSLPDSLFRAAPQTNFTPGDFEDLNAQQISASGYSPIGAGDASLTLYTRRSAAERFNVNQAPDPNVRGLTVNRSLGGTADWRRTATAGVGTLAIRFGLDGAMHSVRVRIYNESQTPTAVPAVNDDDAASSDLTTDVRSPSLNLAGYALAEYHLRRLTLSAGARDDYIRTPFRNVVDPTDDTTSSYHHLSPRGGVTLSVADGASVYGSVSGAFRAPAILELGCADPSDACPLPFALGDDPPLKPVTATTYEIGGRMLRGTVLVTGSLYRTDVTNEIFFIASERALLSGYFTNIDRTRREGGELSVQGTASNAVEWHAGYAFTRATFQSPAQIFSIRSDDGFATKPLAGSNTVRVGNRLPLVPEHQLKAGFLVRGSSVNAGIEGRYTGRQWFRGDEANETTPLPSYLTASFRVGVTRGNWELASVIDNVLDSHAAIFGTFNENRRSGTLERFLTPMNARTFKVSLARNLGRGARE